MTACLVDDCADPARRRGMCGKHYQRWHKHGDPLVVGVRGGHTVDSRAAIGEANRVHGMANTPTHISWMSMRRRCHNPRATQYAYYGGRGIAVDPRWDEFSAFLEDMGERPEWATKQEQANNRRRKAA